MASEMFKGRVAVVTGGAQGIGLAVVEKLLAGGAKVSIWDRDAAVAEETAARLGVDMQIADQTDAAAMVDCAARTEAALGGIDILVASAGISGPTGPTVDYDVETFHQVINVNLNGVYHVNRAVLPGMIKRGYGRIVNIASIAGKEGNPNAAAYSASKAGVIALTKSLGKEMAAHDIAVNCVTPAAAKTRIFDQIAQEHIDFMLSKIPRGRFLQVEEAASMIGWLVSEENSFSTAGVFDLSGGRATY